MEERIEKLKCFFAACDELLDCKFQTADHRISDVLKALAESPDLTALFKSITAKFDYSAAKRTYLRFPAEGSLRGAAFVPKERHELIAFVFCLLVDLDSGALLLKDFLLRYFYVDGSYTASFLLFADRLIRPFRDILFACFPDLRLESKEALKERTVAKNYIYRGRIVNLRCDDAALPDGRPCKREIVEHPGGAAVLSVQDGKVALVKQFRYAYGEEILEIPAGKLEAGEDPKKAALRELAEETGLKAADAHLLYVLYPTPGYTNEKIYIYEATGVETGEKKTDEDEFLDVQFVPLEEAYQMVEGGGIKDAKTIVALLHYKSLH